MDQKTAEEITELYESKLFMTADIAARYGMPHQRVVAVADRVRHERLVAYVRAGISGRSLFENPVDPY